MNIETLREYCLSLPLATEDMPFGDDYITLRVCDKIFACIGLARPDYFVVKCDPDYAIELRDRHPEIEGAWHWNKRHWNQIDLHGSLSAEFIKHLIRHSYSTVARKLSRKTRDMHPEVLTVQP